jgi:hypothetical protein
VEGDVYDNHWLGIRLTKPPGWAFRRLDAIWPDPTLLALEGPSGENIVLEQHHMYPWEDPLKSAEKVLTGFLPEGQDGSIKMAKNAIFLRDAPENRNSAAAVLRGLEMWVFRAEGEDAPALLRKLLGAVEIAPLAAL